MSSQLDFLYHQAVQLIQNGNYAGSELLLNQIIKKKSTHSEALRLLSVLAAQQSNYELALARIENSIAADKRNGVAYSNKGNILLALQRTTEAIEAYKQSIKISPSYAEAYSNLGNALQSEQRYDEAIACYESAIRIDPNNSDSMLNLGNAYLNSNLFQDATEAYIGAICKNPSNLKAHFYLALAQLNLKNFQTGWAEYEWRWRASEIDSVPISTSKPVWQGQSFDGRLLIWAEQGIGDQVLYGSMLHDLRHLPQKKIITTNKKLLPIFKRSFPDFEILDEDAPLSEEQYDYHLPMGSLGRFYRKNIEDFASAQHKYLIPNMNLLGAHVMSEIKKEKKLCGLSWKSSNKDVGREKSMTLFDLSEVLKLQNFEFLNLQYGDTASEINVVKDTLGTTIHTLKEVNLYDDLDHVLSLIEACDIIVTTSNSTAHIAGAAGKEVCLLLPHSLGAIWYWNDLKGVSLWYPSVRIFKQEKQGDWVKPVEDVKTYLGSKFGI